MVFTKPGWMEWANVVSKAQAVVMLGGAGGTYETYRYALQERKPVFPLRETDGDARTVFEEMLANWPHQPMGNITQAEFARTLAHPLDSAAAAEQVSTAVMALIQRRLTEASSPRVRTFPANGIVE